MRKPSPAYINKLAKKEKLNPVERIIFNLWLDKKAIAYHIHEIYFWYLGGYKKIDLNLPGDNLKLPEDL
jgi:hypothetical protein